MRFHLCPVPFFRRWASCWGAFGPECVRPSQGFGLFFFAAGDRCWPKLAHSVDQINSWCWNVLLLILPTVLGNLHGSCFNVPLNPPPKNLSGDSSQRLDVTSFYSLQRFHHDVVFFTESKLHSGGETKKTRCQLLRVIIIITFNTKPPPPPLSLCKADLHLLSVINLFTAYETLNYENSCFVFVHICSDVSPEAVFVFLNCEWYK